MSFISWLFSWLGIDGSMYGFTFIPVFTFAGLFVIAIGCVIILRVVLKICDMVLGR